MRIGFRAVIVAIACCLSSINALPATPMAGLLSAISQGRMDALRSALESPRYRVITAQQRTTLLGHAIARDSAEAVQLLLNSGADPNGELSVAVGGEQVRLTPLAYAISNHCSIALIKALTSAGATVNDPVSGLLPLNFSLSQGQWDVAAHLLDEGAPASGADALVGLTPLMELAVSGKDPLPEQVRSLVVRLVAQGADVNARTPRGTTPLSLAVAAGHAGIVELLLAQGADANARSASGELLIDVARRKARGDIVRLLQQYGAR
jgi:ankyrin repeat protein